jgi:uncharacterized membrane protein
MCLLYVIAGINHFVNSSFYLNIIPGWLPFHVAVNYISGGCEIVFGLLLIPIWTRRIGAWLLIILLIAVFPANIEMTFDYWFEGNPKLWITVVRLPIQFVLIWWAWLYTKPGLKKS